MALLHRLTPARRERCPLPGSVSEFPLPESVSEFPLLGSVPHVPATDRSLGAALSSTTALGTVSEVEARQRPPKSLVPGTCDPKSGSLQAIRPRPPTPQRAVTWHMAPGFVAAVVLGGGVMGTIAAYRTSHVAPWPAGPIGHLLDASMAGPPWLVGLSWALAIAAVVVAHEAGHALTARWVGGRDVRVHLAGLHGRTSYTLDDPWSGRRALVIAAGALAPGIFVPLVLVPHAQAFAVVGSVLLLTNVLPVPVSDGGHLIALLLHRTSASGIRGQRRAGLVELAGLEVLMLGGLMWGYAWLAGLLVPVMALAIAVEIRQRRAGQPSPDPAPAFGPRSGGPAS